MMEMNVTPLVLLLKLDPDLTQPVNPPIITAKMANWKNRPLLLMISFLNICKCLQKQFHRKSWKLFVLTEEKARNDALTKVTNEG